MTEQELKEFALELETTLVIAFLPSFLNYAIVDNEIIHIVISSNQFKNLTIPERTSLVFAKLRQQDAEILEKCTVIVETFTTQQIEDLIEFYF